MARMRWRASCARLSFAKTPQNPESRLRNNVTGGSGSYSFQAHFEFWRGTGQNLEVRGQARWCFLTPLVEFENRQSRSLGQILLFDGCRQKRLSKPLPGLCKGHERSETTGTRLNGSTIMATIEVLCGLSRRGVAPRLTAMTRSAIPSTYQRMKLVR